MRFYFLRHADARPGVDDAARPLSPLGRKQARKLGRFLKDAAIEFDAAYSSPLVRAKETAEILLKASGSLSASKLRTAAALLNETAEAQFERWLKNLPTAYHILLVGHAPTLAEHVCRLLDLNNSDALKLPKGGLVCLESEDRHAAMLKFLITPKLLGL